MDWRPWHLIIALPVLALTAISLVAFLLAVAMPLAMATGWIIWLKR
jgi:hypothetical protein